MRKKVKHKRKTKKILLLFFLIIILTLYCVLNTDIEKKQMVNNTRNYIVYNIGRLPDELLMFQNDNNRQKDILPMLFEGLVKTDANNNIVPALCEKYSYDSKSIKYTFYIRKDAMWSDKTSITSKDFKDFLDTALSKSSLQLKASDFTINCPDECTLEIKLKSENPDFLYILSKPEYCLRKIDDKLAAFNQNYKSIKYSGPFIIKNIDSSGQITLLKNSEYFDKDNVKSEMIVLSTVSSSEIALASFEAGNIDIMADPPFCETDRLIDEKKAVKYNNDTCKFLLFNNAKDMVLSNKETLENIKSSIDVNKLISALQYDFLTEGSNQQMSNDQTSNKINNVNSSKNSSNAGKNNNKKLKFIYEEDSINDKIFKYVKSSIYKSCNIELQEDECSYSSLNDILNQKNYDIALLDCSFQNADNILQGKECVRLYYTPLIVCQNDSVKGVYVTRNGNIKLDGAYLTKNKIENSKNI